MQVGCLKSYYKWSFGTKEKEFTRRRRWTSF